MPRLHSALTIVAILLTAPLGLHAQSFVQLGGDIHGEADRDQLGIHVLNQDGSILAVSAFLNDESAENAGKTQVFERVNDQWVQKGKDILGEGEGDRSRVTAISDDGSVIAVSSFDNDNPNGGNAGHVRVYAFDGDEWTQKGTDIDGVSTNDACGETAMNASGSVIAVGCFAYETVGRVRVFTYDGKDWAQTGASIDGEEEGDRSYRVALNATGSILAIGSRHYGLGQGQVRVFQLSSSNTWVQLGSSINGDVDWTYMGTSVSLSSDGLTLAVSGYSYYPGFSFTDDGRVKVYQYANDQWSQFGSTIVGESKGDEFGDEIALSDRGDRIIISAGFAGSYLEGEAKIYDLVGGEWKEYGSIFGVNAADGLTNISISGDGRVIGVGAQGYDVVGTSRGHVRVYQIDQVPTSIHSASLPSEFSLNQNYPNPFNPVTTISYSIPTSQHIILTVYDVLGKKISVLLDRPVEAGDHSIVFDASTLPSGMYLYQISGSQIGMHTKAMYLIK